MSFRDKPFAPGTFLYPDHAAVAQYLQDLGRKTKACVTYGRLVTRIYLNEADKWVVESRDLKSSSTFADVFDKIFAATGHYNTPFIPWTDGLWTWKGAITHARSYRSAEPFAQEVVLVVGCNASGYDITRELAEALAAQSPRPNKKVYQCVRNQANMIARVQSELVQVVSQIQRIDGSKIYFVDGTILDNVTTLMFATGYLFSFPFCHPTDRPFDKAPLTRLPSVPSPAAPLGSAQYPTGGLAVHNLDSWSIFYMPAPSLAIAALHYRIVPFSFCEAQARVVAAYWSGHATFKLESAPADDDETLKLSLVLGSRQFDYENSLVALIKEGGQGENELQPNGAFNDIASWRRGLRAATGVLKNAVLGH